MQYLIGVDGGGSGCRVILTSLQGETLAKAEGGPSNIETSFKTARENIIDACKKAFKNAKISENNFNNSFAILGLAGSNLGNYAAQLSDKLPFARNKILNDGEITLEGAIGPVDGCIGALGTGSVFVGRKNGITKLTGGWGFNLGDDGSGAKIGKELMKLSIRCHDGLSEHTDLTIELLKKFNNNIKSIVEITKSFKPKDYADFAPEIFRAMDNHDSNAKQIIESEVILIEQSLMASGFSEQNAFCLIGGLGKLFLPFLSDKFIKTCKPPKGNALQGAIAIAKREFF